MIEVLVNESKSDQEQLVIEWGELNYPSKSDDADSNYGQINLGGGNTYLLTNFGDKFSYIKGYTLCAYDQVIKESGSTSCINLTGSKQRFLLNPFDNKATECSGSDENLNLNEKSKKAFLCIEPDSPTTDIFLIATITVLSFGGLCCCVSFIIFCKYRVKKNSGAIDDEEAYINRAHDPIAAQRILE